MKLQFAILILVLACLSSYAQDNVDPFTPPGPNTETPAGADTDPFDPLGKPAKAGDPQGWEDRIVKPGGKNEPSYITIAGWFDERTDQVTVLFRVGVKQYKDAVDHSDRIRGVALISGRPSSPDFYCWLRPFHTTDSTADFVVLSTRKGLEHMHLAFMPREGRNRYLYELGKLELRE